MLPVPPEDWSALRPWFVPERPGPLVFEQVLRSGIGTCSVDREREPRVVLAEAGGGNYALRGDPDAIPPEDLAAIEGMVDAAPEWLPALRRSAPRTAIWQRIIAVLPAAAEMPPPRPEVRRLTPDDTALLAALPADIAWIHETWGGVEGALAAGVVHAAVVDGAIVSVALPFYRGLAHEDLGVVTTAEHRGRGFSTACAAAVVADVRARGDIPTWTTSPDNAGSLGVARRLGFVHHHDDVLYCVRIPIPV
ncbi:GNAT family N-acetyltransferase [Pseudonocardia humida]|uniref:GNAT family N-acetyltransferase n=1 Tax=Pseudonocardia humida TaxID=2800819 RepID=A0ABT1ACY0_9PSEU|nr:GNAT family N-acetyltransferase [Pseudonocardia humida]MCO1660868.1 GNAT family N-acetyltransferase [Pseudonocardia humida]